MKRFIKSVLYITAILIGVTAMQSCDSDTAWDEVPTPITEFLSQYFPGQGVSDYGSSDNVYHVKLRNSAALSFDSNYSWISVNGYGETLPTVFLFDQLPPALYEYIQGIDSLDDVYSVSRDARHYTVSLLDNSLIYTIATDSVKEVTTSAS